jgi:hypothetical protein
VSQALKNGVQRGDRAAMIGTPIYEIGTPHAALGNVGFHVRYDAYDAYDVNFRKVCTRGIFLQGALLKMAS